jgi:hypothetical protein
LTAGWPCSSRAITTRRPTRSNSRTETDHGDAASRIYAGHTLFAIGRYRDGVRFLRRAFQLQPRITYLSYDIRDDYGDPADFDRQLEALREALPSRRVIPTGCSCWDTFCTTPASVGRPIQPWPKWYGPIPRMRSPAALCETPNLRTSIEVNDDVDVSCGRQTDVAGTAASAECSRCRRIVFRRALRSIGLVA